MTRGHWFIYSIWIGSPIVIWLVLNFLSPGYMRDFYDPRLPYFGLFLALVGLNFVFLTVGFAVYISRRKEKQKRKVDESAEKEKMPRAMGCFLFLTLLFCTIPSLWLAIMGGSMSRIAIQMFGLE